MSYLLNEKTCQNFLEEINSSKTYYGEFEFYTLIGSHMYGLETASSDLDILIVTNGKGPGYFKNEDNRDIRVDTILSLMERAWGNTPEDIDLIQSIKRSNINSNFTPMIKNFKPNILKYLDNLKEHTLNDLKRVYRGKLTADRRAKSLKIVCRNVFLYGKVLRDGVNYDPKFSTEEREKFYSFYSQIEDLISSADSAESALDLLFFSK